MTGEELGYFMDLIHDKGALDCSYSPLYMKKGRPGQLIRIICREEDFESLAYQIFKHSSSIGLRYQKMDRLEMDRTIVEESYGGDQVRVKKSCYFDIKKSKAEYEDLRELAEKKGLALREIIKD